jgi:hypothetical protein
MIGETRVLANCGDGTAICQSLNQAENSLFADTKLTENAIK